MTKVSGGPQLEAWVMQSGEAVAAEVKRGEAGNVQKVVERSIAALETVDAPVGAKQAAMTALLLDVAHTLSEVAC
jgi:hypothetical protein